MNDPLRRAAEALWFTLNDGQVIQEVSERQHISGKEVQKDMIIAFAKAQREEEVELMIRAYKSALYDPTFNFIGWLDARAKEWRG